MRTRIRFTIFVAGTSMLLAGMPPAQQHRIGHADIYPDPVRTPGAANPQVSQQNIQDNICNRPMEHEANPAPGGVHEQAEAEAASGIRGHCPSDKGGAYQP